MSAEAVVWLIFIAIWFISGIVKQIRQVAKQRPGQPGAEPAGRQTDRSADADDPMIQLLRQLGGETEVQPQEPPREYRPAPEPRRVGDTLIQAEARARPPQPSRTTARTKVAAAAKIPEMDLPPLPSVGQPVPRRRGSALGREIRRQLRRRESARRAILLREILGPAPGLKGSVGGR